MPNDPSTEPDELLPPHQYPVLEMVPHCRAIDLRVVEINAGRAVLVVPYDDQLVGNPETGVLHGGVLTTLLDNASGIAVQSLFEVWTAIATLDLRIDYMKPATPGKHLVGFAECYRRTRNVAFARGVAYHSRRDDPIATTVATFMLNSNANRS